MATPPQAPNPMAGSMARSIIDTLASRGGSPMQQGGITGGSAQSPDMMSDLLASRMSELGGADPKAVFRLLNQMKQQVSVLIPQLSFRIPGVSKHLATLFSTLDKILEEINKAQQTQNAVQNTPVGGAIAAMQPNMGQDASAGPTMPTASNAMPPLGM